MTTPSPTPTTRYPVVCAQHGAPCHNLKVVAGTSPTGDLMSEHTIYVHLTESQVEDHIRQRTAAEARRASDIQRWRERTTE